MGMVFIIGTDYRALTDKQKGKPFRFLETVSCNNARKRKGFLNSCIDKCFRHQENAYGLELRMESEWDQ